MLNCQKRSGQQRTFDSPGSPPSASWFWASV